MLKKKNSINIVVSLLFLPLLGLGIFLLGPATVQAQGTPALCAIRDSSSSPYNARVCSEAGYRGLQNGRYYRISSLEEATEIQLGNRAPAEISQNAYRESVIDSCSADERRSATECAGVTTRDERTEELNRSSAIEADCTDGADYDNCGITRYLVLFINVLSVLAGIVIAGSIAYGGIQYSMSGSDPQKVSEAKDRIRNAIIALVFFIFGYAILNFLIPGGLL